MFIYKYIDAMVYISVGMMQWGNFHTVIASCTRFIYIMTVNTCIHCRNYVGIDGGGCLYTVIQWITAARVLQREALANGTG